MLSAVSIERFTPALDAIPDNLASPITARGRAELRSILIRAKAYALSMLESDFGAAVYFYPIRKCLEEIITNNELESLLATAGKIFVALDHLFSHTSPPSLNAEAKLRLSSWIEKRSRDFFVANGTQLLVYLVVLRAIPELWLPVESLNENLHRHFRKLPFIEELVIKTQLHTQIPGGIKWLKQKSLQNVVAMEHDCLTAPVPFVLLLRGFDCTQAKIFIANSCRRIDSGELVLGFCDEKDSSQPMEVLLNVQEWGNEFVVIGGERQQVVGLMRVQYSTLSPPLSKLRQFLEMIRVGRGLWRLRRFRKKLFT